VAEADESDRSFLMLSPFIAVLTNIDAEHLDQYKGVEDIKKDFVSFANKVPFYCPVVLCLDDPNLQSIIPQLERRMITYGFSAQSDIYARDSSFSGFRSRSTLHRKGRALGTLKLNVPGKHMVSNAMAAVAVGLDLDIPPKLILEALECYAGTGRRFELKGEPKGVMVVEDYGHHPTEIKATLDGAKRGWERRLVAVFQPHRFTRTAHLLDDFARAFNQADVLLLTEIYPAGETPIPGVTGKGLYEEIVRFGHKDVHFEPDLGSLAGKLEGLVRPGDIVIVLGAGNINRIVPEILDRLEKMP
jgi:UDP-N-acetylmuramate--alanine ligase